MEAGQLIRTARASADLSQTALARRAGTSQATVSMYETGRKQPTVETLIRLLAAAGVRLALERRGTPGMEPSPAQHARVARGLADVLALAEELPARHDPDLRFPRLAA